MSIIEEKIKEIDEQITDGENYIYSKARYAANEEITVHHKVALMKLAIYEYERIKRLVDIKAHIAELLEEVEKNV